MILKKFSLELNLSNIQRQRKNDESIAMAVNQHLTTIKTDSPAHTIDLGRFIGSKLDAGDLIALFGDLGSGKTCLIRGICYGLEISDEEHFSSPSFTLMNRYEGRLPIYHFDFYRLADASEVYDTGIEDFFDGEGVVLIEWADRCLEMLPEERLEISIEFGSSDDSETRIFRLNVKHESHAPIIRELRDVYSGN